MKASYALCELHICVVGIDPGCTDINTAPRIGCCRHKLLSASCQQCSQCHIFQWFWLNPSLKIRVHNWQLRPTCYGRQILSLGESCVMLKVNMTMIWCIHDHSKMNAQKPCFWAVILMFVWGHVKEINEGHISIPWDLLTKCHWGYHKSCHQSYQMLVISYRREMKVPQSGHLHPPPQKFQSVLAHFLGCEA